MILAYRIHGEIDVDRFKEAFQRLIDQNDVFRLVIKINDDGIPEQYFHDEVKSTLRFLDYSNSENASQRYEEWVEVNKKKLFDPEELLYHAVLFKLSKGRFIFYLNQYHLITDGWSMKHVYDELNTLYTSAPGTKETLPNASKSFEIYARKHPFTHQEEVTLYWQKKLDNIKSPPPLYGVQSKNTSSKSSRINIHLGKERTQKLNALAKDRDIRAWTMELALSNIFLTVIAALIYKVGNQGDFSIGIPFHNRMSAEEKKIAGLFMELVSLDVSVAEEDTLIDLFQKLKHESLEVSKNAVITTPPVELLRSFNVLLNFIPIPLDDFAGMPMTCDWILSGHVDPGHLIRLQIHNFNDADDYQLQFDLNNDVFPNEEMCFVADHFIRILDAFIEDKNQKLIDLRLTTEAEIHQISAWNSTDVLFEDDEIILTKFSRQVLKIPDATALVHDGTIVTYRELGERSNQVAQFLIANGTQKGDIIAISLERSIEMVICIYGILKAGAAYLPLDTETPAQRLEFILKDANSRILLYNHDGIEDAILEDFNCLSIQSIWEDISSLSTQNPDIQMIPDDLAYVIYTSGSTGEPKGVMVHHAGVCNRLNWLRADYPITNADTTFLKTPVTFDVSVPELFFALQIGARLVVAMHDEHKDMDKLVKSIRAYQISVIHFVPSVLKVFMETENVALCKSLRILFCSGEALSVSAVEKVYDKLNHVEVHNLYGPTEASVDVSSWHCAKDEFRNGIPIGYPVANTKLYILDKSLQKVPVGVVGELYIAGLQVAKGYLNRAALTAERFVKDTFSQEPNAIMYRTGDLARYRHNGAIEYHGRVDNQVKLRGLRIELGEIEKNMERIGGITQVIASLLEQQNDEVTIVAYYTGNKMEEWELKNFLESRMPAYMVPSHFVYLEQFEFLSSGKVNRKKLPPVKLRSPVDATAYLKPTNEFEELIFNVWQDVLKVDQIGINENFVRVGGNSLNAIVVTSRLKSVFDLESLSIVDVFKYSTIKEYAAYVEGVIIALLEDE